MKCIVTGGGGFVGKALCLKLAGLGHEVSALGRSEYPELEKAGIRCIKLDLGHCASGKGAQKLAQAFAGAEAVFHTAAKVDMWGRWQDFFNTNVIGTRSVIAACRAAGVGKLIFTSSPSVVSDKCDLCGVDESATYPARYMAFYPKTKALAEQEVLTAGERGDLRSVALRPHLIFGPGDRHFVPTILERARQGRLVQVGAGQNLVDVCFIEDCVRAHILALEALAGPGVANGKAYFISQGQPVNLWRWINEVLKLNGLSPIKRKVPKALAFTLAWGFELAHAVMPWHPQPLFTRFLVSQMTTHHYFNINRAREDLGFEPSCTVEEALRRTFG